MRHSIRLAATALILTSLAAANSLQAQRRTSDGGSGGSSSGSSGGSSQPSSGGSSGGSRGGETVSRPASAPSARPSSSGRSEPAATSRPRERDDSPRTASRPSTSTRDGSSAGTSTASRGSSSGRATTGKIGNVRRSADAARRRPPKVFVGGPVYVGGCYTCDYWGWYGGRWGWYGGGWWYPHPDYYPEPRGYDRGDRDEDEDEGQGYLDYPYASNEEGATFVRGGRSNRGFGTLGATYFNDVASDVTAGRFAFEGVSGRLRLDADFGNYAEPVAGGKDRMRTFRAGIGVQPRIGQNAYAIIGVGGRGLWLNNGGGSAGGPEGTLGLQVFPFKPFGASITGRIAGMRWSGSEDNFAVGEVNTMGSIFIGRSELQAGWHWLKIEGAPAFGGPAIGIRMWF